MNLLAALFTICIAIEFYHMFFCEWIMQSIHLMQTTSKKFDDRAKRQQERETSDESFKEVCEDLATYLDMNDAFVHRYMGPMIVEIIYWCILIFLTVFITAKHGISGVVLLIIIGIASLVTSKILKAWKPKESKQTACKVVAIVDSVISICTYIVYVCMYCF